MLFTRFSKSFPILLAALLILSYTLVYQFQPFPVRVNDWLLNIFTVVAALFASVSVGMVLFSYAPDDKPHQVWRNFTLGFSAWAMAEIAWSFYNLGSAEVPVPSIADGLWYLGYIFFTIGFVLQYHITYQSKTWVMWGSAVLIWLVAFGFAVGVTFSINAGQFSLPVLVAVAYPFSDLIVVIFALGLAWAFRGGAFARPWLSMVVFAVSDSLYVWLVQTGVYAWSVETGNPLSLFVDALYIAAYLIVGLGFLSQYHLLHNFPEIYIAPEAAE